MPEPVPQKVHRTYSFTNFQTAQPATPLPGQSVDNELDRSNNTTNDIIDFVRQAITDEGLIREEALDGATGPEGPEGEQGPPGPQGNPGPQGGVGPQGVQGVQGVEGPMGATGPAGAPGVGGPAGAKGDKGDQGDIGLTGATGPKGDKGDTGDTGAPGAAGAPGAISVDAPNDGVGYRRRNLNWTADPIQADAASDGLTYGRKNAAWVDITAELLTGKFLPLTGGTLTGPLMVAMANPRLYLDKPASGDSSAILGRKGVLSRWALVLGGASAESTGNLGSDFNMNRYDDAGTLIDQVLGVARANAAVSGSMLATAAEYLANSINKIATTNGLWASAVPVAVAYAASITLNFSTGINFTISTVTGALALNAPTNLKAGQSGYIRLVGNGTPTAITFPANFYFPIGNKPANTSGSVVADVIWYQLIDTASVICTYVKSYTNA